MENTKATNLFFKGCGKITQKSPQKSLKTRQRLYYYHYHYYYYYYYYYYHYYYYYYYHHYYYHHQFIFS